MDILTQLPAAPAGYDAVAHSGWLGAHALYAALQSTLTDAQLVEAGRVLDDLQARQRLANANALASLGSFEVTGEVVLLTPRELPLPSPAAVVVAKQS